MKTKIFRAINMETKLFNLYTVDPMSASWNYRYPYIRVIGLFVNFKLLVKLIYLLKGYPSFNEEVGILGYRYF